jgi:hypothetical protein
MTRARRARSGHDLRQFDDLVQALDAILHRDLKDWMRSNGDPSRSGF